MDDLKVIVGRNLAALRKRRKLTQLELAEQMNYSDKAVSKWEQGATLPDLETLKQLCDFYGVTLDYLVDKDNILNPQLDTSKEKIVFINHKWLCKSKFFDWIGNHIDLPISMNLVIEFIGNDFFNKDFFNFHLI